jgi:hypothetical protein
MRFLRRLWLSGFVIIESKMVGSERRLMLEFWLPDWLVIYFKFRLLDKNEDEIASETGNQEFDSERQVESSGARKIPFGTRYEQAKEIFRKRPFRRVRIPVKFAEHYYRSAMYVVVDVAEVPPEDAEKVCDQPWYRQPNCIHLRTDRRRLQENRVGHGATFLLITHEKVQGRLEELIEKFPRLRWQDRFTRAAVQSLWRRLFNGRSLNF